MHFDANLGFVLAVSIGANIDNLGVAIAYGMMRRTIPMSSNLFISAVSGFFAIAASAGATELSSFVSKQLSSILSGAILIAIGLWAIADLFRQARAWHKTTRESLPPVRRRITRGESGLLAVALALNAAAAGLATGFGGRPQAETALGITCCSFAAIVGGQWFVKRVPSPVSPIVTQAIGAVTLVAIGIFQFP